MPTKIDQTFEDLPAVVYKQTHIQTTTIGVPIDWDKCTPLPSKDNRQKLCINHQQLFCKLV